jgi:REP element-mobilizing transposase RayT
MVLKHAGAMIQTVWDEIPIHYTGTEIDEFVVMPNHIHGIIVIVGATPCGCPVLSPRGCPGPGFHENEPISGNGQARGDHKGGQARGPAPTMPLALGDIVHRFKTMTTKRYADGVKQLGWQTFAGKLGQRNYWEHIIRNEMELNWIREYIHDNPIHWESDRLNLRNDRSVYPSMVREPVVTYITEGWMV